MNHSATRLYEEEIHRRLDDLQGWIRDGDFIAKEFVLNGFSEAAQFISRIASVADAMDHHPDLYLHKYKHLKVMLTTHSAEGLTQKDFDLAKRIDRLASGLHGI